VRKSFQLALASSALFILGAFMACSSPDNGPTAIGGAGKGGTAGASGGGGVGGSSGANPDGGGGTGAIIINTDAGDTSHTLPDACAGNTVQATLKPAHMVLLIDRTGSMNCNAPPTQTTPECEVSPKKKVTSEPSKWEITRDALISALGDLKSTSPTPSIGMALFNKGDGCEIPTQPDPAMALLNDQHLGSLVTKLQGVTPLGDTPIIGSVMHAYQYLAQQQVVGNKFLVLLTDGKETCDPTNKDLLIGAGNKVQEATLVGIRTFVLGAPGSEAERSFLSSIAFKGQTATDPNCDHGNADSTIGNCHIDMTIGGNFSQQLSEALAKVGGAALTCEIDVPMDDGGKADPDKVNVSYIDDTNTEFPIYKDVSDSGVGCDQMTDSAWRYTDDTKTRIVVCGPMCDQIKKDQNGSLSVQLGCEYQGPK
jgi:hypothetical protein